MFNCHRRTVSQNSSHFTFPYPKSPAAQLQRPRYKHSRSQSPWTWTLFQCSKALRNRDTIRWVVRVQHDKYIQVHYQQGLFCETVNPWWSNLRTPEKLLRWEVSWVAASHQEVFFPFDLHDLSWIDICQLKNMGPTGMFKACDQKMRRLERCILQNTSCGVWMVWVLLVLWLQLHIFASHLWISPPSRSHHWKPATDELNMEGMTQIPLPMKWCSHGQWCINHHSHLRLSYLQDYIC